MQRLKHTSGPDGGHFSEDWLACWRFRTIFCKGRARKIQSVSPLSFCRSFPCAGWPREPRTHHYSKIPVPARGLWKGKHHKRAVKTCKRKIPGKVAHLRSVGICDSLFTLLTDLKLGSTRYAPSCSSILCYDKVPPRQEVQAFCRSEGLLWSGLACLGPSPVTSSLLSQQQSC